LGRPVIARRRDPVFCFALAGIAKAPWRPALAQAHADAIEAGHASMDEWRKTVFMTVPAEIWITYDLVPAFPRGPVVEKKADDPHAGQCRIERAIARRGTAS